MLKESKTEKMVRQFAETVFSEMGWGKMPIKRFKVGNMTQYRGYYLVTSKNDYYIIISNNPDVYIEGYTEKHFWDVVVHELIHAYMYKKGYDAKTAFNHGKWFKHYCKMVEIATNGEFSVRDLK